MSWEGQVEKRKVFFKKCKELLVCNVFTLVPATALFT